MKDAFGNELFAGDEVVYGGRRGDSVVLKRGIIVYFRDSGTVSVQWTAQGGYYKTSKSSGAVTPGNLVRLEGPIK